MRNGGYTHGMMTLLVPEETAQAMARDARRYGITVHELALRILKMTAGEGFVDAVLGEELENSDVAND